MSGSSQGASDVGTDGARAQEQESHQASFAGTPTSTRGVPDADEPSGGDPRVSAGSGRGMGIPFCRRTLAALHTRPRIGQGQAPRSCSSRSRIHERTRVDAGRCRASATAWIALLSAGLSRTE